MASVIFDSSAILALLRDEPGAEVVAGYVGDGLISAVNFKEVIKGLLRRDVPIDAALEMLEALHLDIRAHGRDDAIAAGKLSAGRGGGTTGLSDRPRTGALHETVNGKSGKAAFTVSRAGKAAGLVLTLLPASGVSRDEVVAAFDHYLANHWREWA
jgi:ribonuclease VapC